jgi:hypothetical protein
MRIAFRLPGCIIIYFLLINSCQQATYSFQATQDAPTRLPYPINSAPTPVVAEKTISAQSAGSNQALPLRRSRQFSAHKLRPAVSRSASCGQPRLPVHPLASTAQHPKKLSNNQVQHSPLLSENFKFAAILVTGTLMLLGAGLFLIIGIGGGLAVVGGILLMLAGLAAGLFTLYAITYKHGR